MLGQKRNLGPNPEIDSILRLKRCGLIVEKTDIAIVDPLRHDHPHPFTLNLQCAVLIHGLDIEDQLGGLTRLKVLTFLAWW